MFRRGPKSDGPDPINIMGLDGVVKKKYYPGWSGRIKVEKTRVNSNEGQEVILPFIKGKGFDSKSATISAAFGLNLIERVSSSVYSSEFLPEGKMKGKDNVINFFQTNEEAYNNLLNSLNKKLQEDVLELQSAEQPTIEETNDTTNYIPD